MNDWANRLDEIGDLVQTQQNLIKNPIIVEAEKRLRALASEIRTLAKPAVWTKDVPGVEGWYEVIYKDVGDTSFRDAY